MFWFNLNWYMVYWIGLGILGVVGLGLFLYYFVRELLKKQ